MTNYKVLRSLGARIPMGITHRFPCGQEPIVCALTLDRIGFNPRFNTQLNQRSPALSKEARHVQQV